MIIICPTVKKLSYELSVPGYGSLLNFAEARNLTFDFAEFEVIRTKADEHQRPSIGCNIKWKAGNEPVYFRRR